MLKPLLGALAGLLISAAPAHAVITIPNCGAEGQPKCAWTEQEYWDMDVRSCEFDLKESSNICVNERRRAWGGRNAWELWALTQQRYGISANEPINFVPTIGAHNAFSSTNQGFGGDQSNQTYSISDQLQMGARYLEIDPHFSAGNLRVCHNGVDSCLPAYTRPLANVFLEIRQWLDANPGEVIFVKLDDHIAGANAQLTGLIATYFADKAYKRAADPGAWPTIAQVRAAGKQVLFGSRNNVIPDGNWIWDFTSTYATSEDHPNDYNLDTCTDGDGINSPSRSIRRWSVVAEGRSFSNWGSQTGLINTGAEVERYFKCGVGVLALDYLDALDDSVIPEFRRNFADQRLAASIWSFAGGDFGTNGPALLISSTGRWVSRAQTEVHSFACQLASATFSDRKLVVTSARGPWNRGQDTCSAEFPSSVFSVPTLPQFNEKLRAAAAVLSTDVWLNYSVAPTTDPTVSPGAVQFTARIGTVPGTSQEALILGRTGKTLVAKSNASWVKVSLPDGSVALDAGNRVRISIAPSASSFAAGDYTTTVAVGYAGEGQSNSIRVDYKVQAVGVATLSLTPATVRQPDVVTATVTLSAGSSPLAISGGVVQLQELIPPATEGGTPTVVTRGSQTVSTTGSSVQVPITLNSLQLSQGTHQLFASYSGGTNFLPFDSPTRPLVVQPRIVTSPTAMQFVMPQGGPLPAAQLLKVAPTGSTLQVAKFPTWAGGTAQGSDFLIAINSSALGFGTGAYAGSFIVADGNPGEATVALDLIVQSPLQLSRKSRTLTASGEPVTTSFDVLNTDGRPLTVQGSASWLSASLSQKVAPATVLVSASPVGLAPGTFTGKVTVRSPWAAKSAVFNVTFNVTAP